MSLTLELSVAKDSVIEGLDEENIGPVNLTITKGDDFIRRRMTLSPTKWKTLDAGDVGTPWGWFVFNIGDDNVSLGFGQGEASITLEPSSIPAIWTGSVVPYAKGTSASSAILYVVVIIV